MAVTYSGPMTIKDTAVGYAPPDATMQYHAFEEAEDNPMQQFVAPEYALKSSGGGAVSVGGGMPYGDDATNLASLFDSLNQISAIRERAGGGTGGGTQKFEGNMDMNKLIALNPYMEKNVTSFAQGGTLPSEYHDISPEQQLIDNMSVMYDSNYQGGSRTAENRLIEAKKKSDFFYDNIKDTWSGGSSDTAYNKAYAQEKQRREEAAYNQALSEGRFFEPRPDVDLKNPWEQGYDNWYTTGSGSPTTSSRGSSSGGGNLGGIDRDVMRRNTYDDGGVLPEYNQGGMYERAANQAIAQNQLSGLVANAMNKRAMMMAKGGKFKPHMMYNPKTGEGYMANKLQDHLDMKEKGYDHRKRNPENYPKAAYGMKMKKRYTNGGRF